MKVELPELKRCCYCIPLRYGLLAWGYIKLVMTIAVLIMTILILHSFVMIIVYYYMALPFIIFEFIITVITLMCLLVDIGMTIAFLIGGHRKTTRLLRVFYVYSIVLWSIVCTLFLTLNVLILVSYNPDDHRHRNTFSSKFLASEILLGITYLAIQAYIILLLRSEINKLSDNRNFRFTNMEQESRCQMENGTHESENVIVTQKNDEENVDPIEEITAKKEAVKKQFGYDKL